MRLIFGIAFLIFIISIKNLLAQDLPFYMEQAKANSPLIQDNKNLSEAAHLEAERLKAFYTKSQLTLTGAYMLAPIISHDNSQSELVLNSPGAEKYSGYDIASSNAGVYQGMINW